MCRGVIGLWTGWDMSPKVWQNVRNGAGGGSPEAPPPHPVPIAVLKPTVVSSIRCKPVLWQRAVSGNSPVRRRFWIRGRGNNTVTRCTQAPLSYWLNLTSYDSPKQVICMPINTPVGASDVILPQLRGCRPEHVINLTKKRPFPQI